jgi:ABC-2 type transport system ATP-binding protein
MLKLEALTKIYGKFIALDNISLEVAPGEIFGFLGPNGAGKTTTLKIIAGLLKPSSGRVYINGIDLALDPVRAKRLMGYIPDNPFLYQKLTGREFLNFICGAYGVAETEGRERIESLLDLFDLTPWSDELIEGYSHGMKQRLVMSASLLHQPQLLIVDEPMVGLDPKGAQLVKNLFKDLAQQGTAIFMSTHTLSLAQELCHRIAIIHKGRLIALGTMQELQTLALSQDHQLEDIFFKLTAYPQETGCGKEVTNHNP